MVVSEVILIRPTLPDTLFTELEKLEERIELIRPKNAPDEKSNATGSSTLPCCGEAEGVMSNHISNPSLDGDTSISGGIHDASISSINTSGTDNSMLLNSFAIDDEDADVSVYQTGRMDFLEGVTSYVSV